MLALPIYTLKQKFEKTKRYEVDEWVGRSVGGFKSHIKAFGQKLKFKPVNTKDGIIKTECYL